MTRTSYEKRKTIHYSFFCKVFMTTREGLEILMKKKRQYNKVIQAVKEI